MSLWTQGCPHHCKDCFNPETWDKNKGYEFTIETLEYIFDNIDSFGIDRSLSILGGEPLAPYNIDGLLEFLKVFRSKYKNKTIYLWTGYKLQEFNEKQLEILKYIDILIDGKFEADKKDISLKLRGSRNQKVYNIKESRIQNKLILLEEI